MKLLDLFCGAGGAGAGAGMKEYLVYLHDGSYETVHAKKYVKEQYVYAFYIDEVLVLSIPVWMVERIVEVKE